MAVTASEMARRMLHLLVTRSGKTNVTGGLHIGRETVLPLLIDALTGPDPDPTAWIEAIAAGSFDLTGYKAYGAPNAKTGAPGNFLPRLLKRYEKASSRPGRKSELEAADMRTALGILIATTLIRELKNAVNARAALGAAWPLTEAVSSLKHAQLRKLIAHFGVDLSFQEHIANGIEAAVQSWIHTTGISQSPLTKNDVDHHVKDRSQVAAFFARQKSAAARREDALVSFGRLVISGGASDDDEPTKKALARIHADRTQRALPPLAAYLDDKQPAPASQIHYRWLQALMPIAAGPSTPEQIKRSALNAAAFCLPECQIAVTGVAVLDHSIDHIAHVIFEYACHVGPPPPAVALTHLAWFEASVCFHAVSNYFPARDNWKAAGLMPCEENKELFADLINRMSKIAGWVTLDHPNVDNTALEGL